MHPFEDLVIPSGAVGIHWFGQNSYALKDETGTIVQVDPYFPRERPASQFIHARPPLNEAALRTDFVLLTHDHGDHTCLESLQRIRAAYPDARYVGPSESIHRLQEAGFPTSTTAAIAAGDRIDLAGMTIHALWSKPPDGIAADSIAPPGVQHLGYVVEVGRERVYITGDLVNTFADHEELLAPVRALRPTLGLLTTHPDEGEFPFFDGSARIAASVGLKAASPAHYQCFVTRTYDPQQWAAQLQGVQPLLIAYNQAVVYPS